MKFSPEYLTHLAILYDVAKRGEPYEKQVTMATLSILNAGDTFVDIGAHIGWFTLLAAKIVGISGRVLAVEPEPVNFAWLRDHINMNGLNGNVRIRKCVATDTTGKCEFFLNKDNDGGHALWPPALHGYNVETAKNQESIESEGVTLEEICAREGVSTVNLLKIDTEGAELAVLKGAERMIEKHLIKHVIAEVNAFGLHQMGTSEKELMDYMTRFGYSNVVLDKKNDDEVFNVVFSAGNVC